MWDYPPLQETLRNKESLEKNGS
jgi:hypothetical protein